MLFYASLKKTICHKVTDLSKYLLLKCVLSELLKLVKLPAKSSVISDLRMRVLKNRRGIENCFCGPFLVISSSIFYARVADIRI